MASKPNYKSKKVTKYDPRMTDESKAFAKIYVKSMNENMFENIDINTIRNILNKSTFRLNDSMEINGVSEKEYFVQSETDKYQIPVSAYIPNNVSPRSPIVVYLHGGGWCICSRQTHYHALAKLAELSGCIWLSVEYRLAPEHKFPKGLNDCVSTVRWVCKNKTNLFNCDKNAHVGVSGDSAGGSMSAIIAHELKDLLSFQILIYPCVQYQMEYNSYNEFQDDIYLLTPDLLRLFTMHLINSLNDLNSPRLLVIKRKDFKNLPSCLIIAAQLDPLVDDSREYTKKLQENGIYCQLHVIDGVQHGFFNLPQLLPNAYNESCKYILDFLNKFKIESNQNNKTNSKL